MKQNRKKVKKSRIKIETQLKQNWNKTEKNPKPNLNSQFFGILTGLIEN